MKLHQEGCAIELTKILSEEKGLVVDMEGYKQCMNSANKVMVYNYIKSFN